MRELKRDEILWQNLEAESSTVLNNHPVQINTNVIRDVANSTQSPLKSPPWQVLAKGDYKGRGASAAKKDLVRSYEFENRAHP